MNRWTVILLVAAVIIGGVGFLVLLGRGRPPQPVAAPTLEAPTTAVEPTTTTPPPIATLAEGQARDSDQKVRFTRAVEQARRWQSDALLYGLEIRSNETLDSAATNETYVFGSRRDTTNWYVVTVNVGTDQIVRQISPRTDIFSELKDPINFQFFKNGPYSAFVTADEAQGRTIRDGGELVSYRLFLYHGPPEGLLGWYVTYEQLGGVDTTVVVNAATGTIESESETSAES